MTLTELLTYLDQNTEYDFLSGSAEETLSKALDGSHPNEVISEMLKLISEKCGCQSADCMLERVTTVNAMGPLRLKFMADDAPVEGFRLVERSIVAIDDAFNAEALRNRAK